jgi:hypothetical protein
MYPNYPVKYSSIPTQATGKPQSQQPAPVQQSQPSQQSKILEKVVSQPQVSIQQIPMHQQKVYLTNTGQVISNVPIPSQQQQQQQQQQQLDPAERQQWIATHDKIPQPIQKRFVMEYEEAQRAQQQAAQQQQSQPQVLSPQQQGVKRTYVIESTNVHPLPSPSQPVMNHQGKTIIGLSQAPQILTGAVASPPLKAHMSSQQPIVTGMIECSSCFIR